MFSGLHSVQPSSQLRYARCLSAHAALLLARLPPTKRWKFEPGQPVRGRANERVAGRREQGRERKSVSSESVGRINLSYSKQAAAVHATAGLGRLLHTRSDVEHALPAAEQFERRRRVPLLTSTQIGR